MACSMQVDGKRGLKGFVFDLMTQEFGRCVFEMPRVFSKYLKMHNCKKEHVIKLISFLSLPIFASLKVLIIELPIVCSDILWGLAPSIG